MIAKTQYNDFTGTAAADIADFEHNSLQDYLARRFRGFDGGRYRCDGCKLWVSGQQASPTIDIKFVCYDNDEKKYVYLYPSKKLTTDEILSLFKRLEVVIGKNVKDIDIQDDDWVELE